MCSSKSISLANSLENELSKIGMSAEGFSGNLFSKFEADIEKVRRQLHKIIDDYLDTVRNDLIRKLKGQAGEKNGLAQLLEEIRMMIFQLRTLEKQLYSTNI